MYNLIKNFKSKMVKGLKRKGKVIRFYRQQEKFRKLYPQYEIGIGSYFGKLNIHDWDEGTTLKIGSYCSLADDINIFLGGNHRIDWVSTYPFPAFVPKAKHIKSFGVAKGDVIIGSDVWISSNVSILSGVTIGHGAVVGNSAIVTKDVPPYAVVAGNPAKVIKYRFDKEVVDKLLSISWWDWSPEEVIAHPEIFCSQSLDPFFDYAASRDC
ncbi:CatB-related O-acetyltransferase [Endozoicomonas ascidiicola]|uniref:CatB-related O-acetyltransferase n=1 Tax=Endozoicomonas ascidiicola TaxID=1698521 RepID=UPI00247FC1CC|nr:CatB-related O-acetyltransferase [Endozoicomonas ascidiicola]